jgi:hypothetical protein
MTTGTDGLGPPSVHDGLQCRMSQLSEGSVQPGRLVVVPKTRLQADAGREHHLRMLGRYDEGQSLPWPGRIRRIGAGPSAS